MEAAPGSAALPLFSWLAWAPNFWIFRVSFPQVCARCLPRHALQFSRDCALGASAKVNTWGVGAFRALVFWAVPLAFANLSWWSWSVDGARLCRAGPNSGCCEHTWFKKNEVGSDSRVIDRDSYRIQLTISHTMRTREGLHLTRANCNGEKRGVGYLEERRDVLWRVQLLNNIGGVTGPQHR